MPVLNGTSKHAAQQTRVDQRWCFLETRVELFSSAVIICAFCALSRLIPNSVTTCWANRYSWCLQLSSCDWVLELLNRQANWRLAEVQNFWIAVDASGSGTCHCNFASTTSNPWNHECLRTNVFLGHFWMKLPTQCRAIFDMQEKALTCIFCNILDGCGNCT